MLKTSDNSANSTGGGKHDTQNPDSKPNAWAKIRERGKLRYVLVNGIAGFGLLNAMLFVIFMAVFRNLQHSLPIHHGHGFTSFGLSEVLFMLICFAVVAGGLWGLSMWHWNEKRYRQRNTRTN